MDYKVAIPTYRRANYISEHTLKYLNDVGVSSDKIDLFVANEDEKREYQEKVSSDLYNDIIVGKLGIGNQRTYIRKYYPIKQKLVMLDDDIEELVKLNRIDRVERLENFDKFVRYSYKLLKKYETVIMGIASLNFSMYMTHSYNVGLYFLIGLCTVEINSHNLNTFFDVSEDYDVSLQAYKKYGSVLRWNNVAAVNASRKNSKQMESVVTTNLNFKTKEKLLKRYPHYIKKKITKYNTFEIVTTKQKNDKRIYVKSNIFD